jgi:hypothetical protein
MRSSSVAQGKPVLPLWAFVWRGGANAACGVARASGARRGAVQPHVARHDFRYSALIGVGTPKLSGRSKKAKKAMSDQSTLWGSTLEYWDKRGVWLMIAGGVLGFVALGATLASSFVLWRVAGVAQTELESKTSLMDVELERQKAKTSEFEKETALLKIGVAEANARADEARLELEKFKTPRDFPTEKQSLLTEKMRKFSNIQFDTGVASPDPEHLFLLKQITEALEKAGWTAVAWHGPGLTIGDENSDRAIGLASVAGIAIFVNPDSKTELWAAVAELTDCLNDAGLSTHNGRMAVSGNTNADTIHVMVGRKM